MDWKGLAWGGRGLVERRQGVGLEVVGMVTEGVSEVAEKGVEGRGVVEREHEVGKGVEGRGWVVKDWMVGMEVMGKGREGMGEEEKREAAGEGMVGMGWVTEVAGLQVE